MAAIAVTTWAEFVTAVGTSGADVTLPENDIWDMNEILPHFNQNLDIACASINGNGTEIKNLHITGHFHFTAATNVQDISFTNILADGSGGGAASKLGFFYAQLTGTPGLSRCTISGIFGNGYHYICAITDNASSYWRMTQCSFNCDFQNGAGIIMNGYARPYACRFFLTLPSAATVRLGNAAESFNEFVVNAPNATTIAVNSLAASTLRGNLTNVRTISHSMTAASDVGVYSTASIPSATVSGNKIIGVTDAQMKDADYLASIGFLIGTDEEA